MAVAVVTAFAVVAVVAVVAAVVVVIVVVAVERTTNEFNLLLHSGLETKKPRNSLKTDHRKWCDQKLWRKRLQLHLVFNYSTSNGFLAPVGIPTLTSCFSLDV